MSHTLRPALPLRPSVLAVIAFHAGFVLMLLLNLDRVVGAKPEFVPQIEFIRAPVVPQPDPPDISGPRINAGPPLVPPPDIPYDGSATELTIPTVQQVVPVPDNPVTPIVWTKAQILEQTEIPYPTVGSIKPEGTVRLRLKIDVNGRPIDVAVGTSSGYVALDRAAARAVAHWRFKPRLLDGNPIESWVEVPIVFRLRD
ncbi:MAG TPA: energy transducer TonB [Steroidobacteraceae bacterium]|nr:energy transducer TonB [Steroidobacteraceae bacterium]